MWGVLVITTPWLLPPDWFNWYGTHAWLNLPTALKLEPGQRLKLFSSIPQSDAWIDAIFWIPPGSAELLTIGLFTRTSSILVFICPNSIQRRNLYITRASRDSFCFSLRPAQRVLLALGLLFHLWLEYSLNIPLFQWDILSSYILFVDQQDISRV